MRGQKDLNSMKKGDNWIANQEQIYTKYLKTVK